MRCAPEGLGSWSAKVDGVRQCLLPSETQPWAGGGALLRGHCFVVTVCGASVAHLMKNSTACCFMVLLTARGILLGCGGASSSHPAQHAPRCITAVNYCCLLGQRMLQDDFVVVARVRYFMSMAFSVDTDNLSPGWPVMTVVQLGYGELGTPVLRRELHEVVPCVKD